MFTWGFLESGCITSISTNPIQIHCIIRGIRVASTRKTSGIGPEGPEQLAAKQQKPMVEMQRIILQQSSSQEKYCKAHKNKRHSACPYGIIGEQTSKPMARN